MKIRFLIPLYFFISSVSAQSNVDLKVRLINPIENSDIPPMKSFDLKVMITNVGTDSLSSGDSLAFYLLVDNDSFLFTNGSNIDNFKVISGVSLNKNNSTQIKMPFGFDNSFVGQTVDLCVFIKPINRKTNAVYDSILDNNKGCALVNVKESSTGIVTPLTLDSDIRIYPNPTKDYFQVYSDESIEFIGVRDIMGNEVKTLLDQDRIDCSQLSGGIYFVIFKTGDKTIIKKIVVVD